MSNIYPVSTGHNHDDVYAKIGEGGSGGVTDHGALTGLGDNDHPQYLLTTGKAADCELLDGLDSTNFATSGHVHTGVYLPIADKAADSDKLDNLDSYDFVQTGTPESGGIAQAIYGYKSFNELPGVPTTLPIYSNQVISKYAALEMFLPLGGKAVDSDKLDNLDSTDFALVDHEHNTFSTTKLVTLATPLTSTSFNGDSFGSQGKALMDLSALYGVPPGIKAVRLKVAIRDSGSAGTSCVIQFSGNPDGTNYATTIPASEVNDRYAYGDAIVPCNPDGDIYYQISASGTLTMDVYIEVWGYWIDEAGIPVATYENCQVSAYRDSTAFTLTTSGSIYAIPLNTENFDTHGFHDNTTNPERLTCQKAGTYIVTGTVTFAANATGNRDSLLRVNGTDYVGNMRNAAMSSGSTSVPVTAIVSLNVGDYIELCGRQYSGGALALYYTNSINNYMTMVMITETLADGWQGWTPTQTGWTALPTGTYRYYRMGKMCFFAIDITAGTSNSNLAVLSLPVSAKPGTYWGGVNGMAMNNSTVLSVASKWYIDASTGNITFGTDMGSGLWTTSGTKRIRCEGFYETA